MIDLIAIILLIASLIGIGLIVARKFPLLASIDVQATESPSTEKKITILEQRLKRKFTGLWSRAKNVSQPVLTKSSSWAKQAQQKLVDLEHEYKVRSLPVWLNRRQRQKMQTEIQEILDQAELFAKDEEYRAAEEKALQAIRLDPRSIPAFEFLGELYMDMKEYGHAKEVYKYLLKISGESDKTYEHLAEADIAEGSLEDAERDIKQAIALNHDVMPYYLELAQIERQLANWAQAFDAIQEAAHREPNHPKVLDEMIEISLGYGKKQFAEDAIAKIKETNPDNKKIPEWETRLAELA